MHVGAAERVGGGAPGHVRTHHLHRRETSGTALGLGDRISVPRPIFVRGPHNLFPSGVEPDENRL